MTTPDSELDRVALTESILDSIGEGIVYLDVRGNWIVNAEGRRMLGSDFDTLPPDQWSARYDVFEADGTTLVDAARRPVNRALRGDFCEPTLYVLRHAQALEGIVMQISARPVHNRDGSLAGALVVFRDVTATWRDEQRIRRLAAIVESVEDAIISTAKGGTISGWNPGAERLFGYTSEEALGKNIRLIYAAEPPQELRDRIRRGERIPPFESQVVVKGGGFVRVLVSVSPLMNAEGSVIGSGVVVRDLTDVKRIEAARLRLAAIVESSTDAILSKDLKGTITSWNFAAERLYGYRSEEVIGRNVSLLVPPDLSDELAAIMKRVESGDRIEQYDTQRLRKDGLLVDVSITISPVWDSRGVIVGASAIARDISERRRAEEQIKRLNLEREELSQRLTNILDTALDAVVTMDASGRIVLWNATAERIFGWSAAEVLGRSMSETIIPSRYRQNHRQGVDRFLKTGEGPLLGKRVEIEALRRNGEEFPIELSIAVTSFNGKPLFSGFIRDLSEARQREQALKASEERYRQTVETAFEGIWHINAEEKTTFVNRRMCEMLGYEAEEMIGRPVTDFMDAEARTQFEANVTKRPVGMIPHDVRFIRKDGSVMITSLEASPNYDQSGAYTGSLAMITDVTARTQAELALKTQTSLYEALFKAQSDLGEVIILSDGTRPVYVNDALSRLSGYSTEELMSMGTLVMLQAPEASNPAPIQDVPVGVPRTFESMMVTKQGKRLDIDVTFMRFEAGGRPLFLTLARDISARKEAQRALEHQALHDPETGLPNRAQLTSRLRATIEASAVDGRPLSVLMFDLDAFKGVNETFGHEAGDRVLEQVGARLQGELRGGDLVARLGGDEYTVLAVGADPRVAEVLAARLLVALDRPIEVEGQLLDVGASVGIACYPRDGETAEALLRHGQIALTVAKRQPGSSVRFAPELERQGQSPLALMAELRQAIFSNQLRLEYQPLVGLKDGELRGVEALVRWDHPERGTVPPAEFIPLAEKTRLIQPLTRWVLSGALRQAHKWRAAGRIVPVSVNISMRDLVDSEFPDTVARALHEAGGAPDWLSLEITEGVIMADPQRAIETMGRLRQLGVRLAVDDFGTGYSSLSYLHRLPVEVLKIDRSFISEMVGGSSGANIVRASVELGHSLRLETVAEGVEGERTMELLGALGCDTAQGYFISQPMKPADLGRWQRRWQSGPWGPAKSKGRIRAA